MKDILREMHQGEKGAHYQYSPDRVPELFLEEAPEIDLLGKRYADELIDESARGQHDKPLSCPGHEEPEGQEQNG